MQSRSFFLCFCVQFYATFNPFLLCYIADKTYFYKVDFTGTCVYINFFINLIQSSLILTESSLLSG
jgi:hypothetical protein